MEEKIQEKIYRKCSICQITSELNNDNFTHNKSNKTGFDYVCKKCNHQRVKEYYELHKDERKEYARKHGKNYRIEFKDKEHLRAKNKYAKYKDKHSQYNKQYNQTQILYNSKVFQNIMLYEETRKDPNNNELGQVKCTYCGKWYNPLYKDVKRRTTTLNLFKSGEGRLYCSNNCKKSCPIFKRIKFPKNYKPMTSREVDPLIRQMAMERDNYQCQKCLRTTQEIPLHAHHILSYKKNIMLANDIDNVIILCKECHKEVHQQEGCKYSELKCE